MMSLLVETYSDSLGDSDDDNTYIKMYLKNVNIILKALMNPKERDFMDYIKIEDLTVAYDLKPVLWDIDVNFQRKLIAILGPNGAGKSTL